MPDTALKTNSGNRLLAHLSPEDLGLLQPHLSAVDLPVRKQLESRNTPITHVYFVESGIVSVVADGTSSRSIEVGLIGAEGMTGLAVIMGTDRSINETFVQVAGHGLEMTATALRRATAESASLQRTLLQYAHAFLAQTTQTALANGRSKIEERLARWLLMAHDRMAGDELTLTHEFLAMMLGVRRPGVTVALNLLERQGLIQAQRGVITIVDRAGLEESANGAYGAPEAELRRLFN